MITRRTRHRCRRGVTLMEMVVASLILAFITVATAQLYHGVDGQHREARFYSDAQARIREALRVMLRTLRHGSAIETNGAITFYNGVNSVISPASSTSQVIVTVPQPNNTTGSDHIRFYLSGTTLYAQRSDDTNLGVAIATGVQTLTFNYFQTQTSSTGTSRSAVDGAPGSGTEVQITLVLTSSDVTTTETAYVELRNKSLGF
jgi:prepilin-type N-terminal cleavage/methylation domain-containing protein